MSGGAQAGGPDSGAGVQGPQAPHAPQARLLFVCLGNICRSPTAEGVMRSLLQREGLDREVLIDSAGTGAWHVGESPDARASEAARRRGFELSGAARQVKASDFEDFDLLLAMDSSNARDLLRIAPHSDAAEKVRLLREFDSASAGGTPSGNGATSPGLDVPDPYFGGPGGFEEVIDLVEAACLGLLEHLELAPGARR